MSESDRPERIDHSAHSMLRELIVEYLFVGELLRSCWERGISDVEVLRSDTDSFGYDLLLSRGSVSRHVQLKTSRHDARTDQQKISLSLATKPSGCVIWILLTADLRFHSFLWFGASPNEPLPDISKKRTARHAKGNSEGVKNERANHRELQRKDFEKLESLADVLNRLFGETCASHKDLEAT